jgi:hypothetical protein
VSKTPSDAAASKAAAARKQQVGKAVMSKAGSAKAGSGNAGTSAAGTSADVPPEGVPVGGSLGWAIRLLYAEAIFTGLVVLVTIWLALAADNVSVSSAIATPAIAAFLALIWSGLATTLRRRRAWARGPAIVLQMLLIPIGYYMVVGGIAWLGVPVMVVGLLGSGLLLAPSTRTELGLN